MSRGEAAESRRRWAGPRRAAGAWSPLLPALGALLAALSPLPPAPLPAQGEGSRPPASALRKSDLVRFLTGTTYTKGEIAAIVQRSCLAFVPTPRDREDLQALGATDAIFNEIDACVRKGNQTQTARAATGTPEPRSTTSARPLEIVVQSSAVSAVAGTVAYITVRLERGDAPQRGTRLVLQGVDQMASGLREPPSAVTDARGRATFALPAGTRAGSYRLAVATDDGEPIHGTNTVTLTTLPAAPATALLEPSAILLEPGARDTQQVVATITDGFGNAVPNRTVQLRPPAGRSGLSVQTAQTSDSGVVRFQVPVAPLRDADTFALVVGDRQLATLRASTSPAVVAANMAAARANMAAARTSGLMLEAARLASGGRHADAEAVYDSVLAVDSNIVTARLGRGYVRSWQRKDDAARQDFLAVLAVDSVNLSALTGLGYSYAWAGEYAEAEMRFRDALRIAPRSVDADKGLAYVALWRGNPREAVRRFRGVAERHPRDAEAEVGLGQAYLQLEDPDRARAAFERAIALDPRRRDARDGLRTARGLSRPVVEVSAWGGYTAFSSVPALPDLPGGDNSEIGLRFAEIAYWPTRTVRLWAQYENGLSLDNIVFVRAGETAPSYYLGGFVNYGDAGRYTTRLEAGYRELPGRVRQALVRGEQVIAFPASPVTLKVGGWVGPRNDHVTEWLTHAAVSWSLTPRFRLEPTLFYARSGAPGANEQRLLVFGEYAFPSGWKLGSGIAGGRADPGRGAGGQLADPLAPSGDTETLWDAFVITELPVAQHRAHLLVRHQQIIDGAGLTVVALGMTFGW